MYGFMAKGMADYPAVSRSDRNDSAATVGRLVSDLHTIFAQSPSFLVTAN